MPDFSTLQERAPRVELREFSNSTNAELRDSLRDGGEWPHGSVMLTRDQRQGRGRIDRSWSLPAGAGLAVSVLVRLDDVSEPGWIPLAAGAAMAGAIDEQLSYVELKWPNDVLVEGRKICGILAEVVEPGVFIVGSGINTAMTAHQAPVRTATSFAMLGREADEDQLVASYWERLMTVLEMLAEGRVGEVRSFVGDALGTIGRDVRAEMPDGTVVEGVAKTLDGAGRLVIVDDAGDRTAVAAADIVHLR